jgi:hypothetical protein
MSTSTTTTSPVITSALVEYTDPVGNMHKRVTFYDGQGEELPGWHVPLDLYIDAHEGLPDPWALTHRIVVARAVMHHLPVPSYVLDSHDARLLAEMVVREQRLHGPLPNKHCRICSPRENIGEEG